MRSVAFDTEYTPARLTGRLSLFGTGDMSASQHRQLVKHFLENALPAVDYQLPSSTDSSEIQRFKQYIASISNHHDWNFREPIAQHIDMHLVALKTGVVGLEKRALEALTMVFRAIGQLVPQSQGVQDFIYLAARVFAVVKDDEMRELVVSNAAWHHSILLLEPGYSDLLAEGGDFVRDLAVALGRLLEHDWESITEPLQPIPQPTPVAGRRVENTTTPAQRERSVEVAERQRVDGEVNRQDPIPMSDLIAAMQRLPVRRGGSSNSTREVHLLAEIILEQIAQTQRMRDSSAGRSRNWS